MIIITGAGRSGTSFLMELFTMLDFNTGFSKKEIANFLKNPPFERAGFEKNYSKDFEIIKSPGFMMTPELIVTNWNDFEYLIIPVRKSKDSSKSRILIQEKSGNESSVNGGMIGIDKIDEEKQEQYLLKRFYNFFFEISILENKKIIFVRYPELKDNSRYLFEKINMILTKKKIDYPKFKKQFDFIRKEDWSLLN